MFVLPCFCYQSYVCVGHLSTDYCGLHSDWSLGGSLPYTSGLGQTVAGQHTHSSQEEEHNQNRHLRLPINTVQLLFLFLWIKIEHSDH